MKIPTYDVNLMNEESNSFEFISEGKNGSIAKLVVYQEIAQGVFNLAFDIKYNLKSKTTKNNVISSYKED